MPANGAQGVPTAVALTATAPVSDTASGTAYLELQVSTENTFTTGLIADITSEDVAAPSATNRSVVFQMTGATRDAALWPFGVPGTSVWNTAIGGSATYSAGGDPRNGDFNGDTGGTNNVSYPVFYANATDPTTNVSVNSVAQAYQIPAAATPSADSVEGMVVVSADHTTTYETTGTVLGAGGGLITGNLLSYTDQDFESNVGSWVANTFADAGCTVARTNVKAYNGSWSLVLHSTAATSIAQTGQVTVAPSTSYTAIAYLNGVVGRNPAIVIQWLDNTSTVISSVSSATLYQTGNWLQISVTGPSPVNAAACTVYLDATDAINGDNLYIDYVYLGTNPTPAPPATGWTATAFAQVDLIGQGTTIASGSGFAGVRGCGASAVGGLIRQADQAAGVIGHALAIGLAPTDLLTTAVWPAAVDPGQSGASGHNPMGELVAIPASVVLSGLGLTANGLIVATALQNYGGYVVEIESGGFRLYAEPGINATFLSNINSDMHLITAQLRVVTNSATSIAALKSAGAQGGGAPLVTAPPPIAQSPNMAPTNTASPTISGSAVVGSVLTGSPGSWSGAPTFAYQWRWDQTTNIAGANAVTYTVASTDVGHRIDLLVTATNSVGSVQSDSALTAVITGSGGGGGGNGTFTRPFSSGSLWYRTVAASIAAGAAYGSGGGGIGSNPAFPIAANGFSVDIVYIYQADHTQPARNLMCNGNTGTGQPTGGFPANLGSQVTAHDGNGNVETAYIPASTVVPFDSGSSGINACMAHYDPNTGNVFETNAFVISSPGAQLANANVFPVKTMNSNGTLGSRGASTLSCYGPAVRPGELESAGINHAMAFTIPVLYLLQTAGFKGGGGFTTPAATADGDYNQNDADLYRGNRCWMGSLLAIRPQDLSTVLAGLPNQTTQGKNFANAMCTYGGYAAEASSSPIGSGWELWMLQMDNAAIAGSGVNNGPVSADLNYVMSKVWVVLNNDPPTG